MGAMAVVNGEAARPGDGRLSPVPPGRRGGERGWTGFPSLGAPRENRDRHYTAEQPGVRLPQPGKAEHTTPPRSHRDKIRKWFLFFGVICVGNFSLRLAGENWSFILKGQT